MVEAHKAFKGLPLMRPMSRKKSHEERSCKDSSAYITGQALWKGALCEALPQLRRIAASHGHGSGGDAGKAPWHRPQEMLPSRRMHL